MVHQALFFLAGALWTFARGYGKLVVLELGPTYSVAGERNDKVSHAGVKTSQGG